MEFRVARAARKTGEILARLVRESLAAKGIPEPDAVVCYGAGTVGPLPALNACCSKWDKMEQGQTLNKVLPNESVLVIPTEKVWKARPRDFPLPVVARRVRHSKGKDMRVCSTQAGVKAMLVKGRHDFVTPVVESDTEYRAWVYRKRCLAIYEKRLTEPEKNVKFGRNRANGWTFHQVAVNEVPESVRRVAVAAVKALALDFGAVDILGKWDPEHVGMHATVLEVNSAPGVSDEHRSAIVRLTQRVVKWVEAGCPPRGGV